MQFPDRPGVAIGVADLGRPDKMLVPLHVLVHHHRGGFASSGRAATASSAIGNLHASRRGQQAVSSSAPASGQTLMCVETASSSAASHQRSVQDRNRRKSRQRKDQQVRLAGIEAMRGGQHGGDQHQVPQQRRSRRAGQDPAAQGRSRPEGDCPRSAAPRSMRRHERAAMPAGT